jgi:predicted TIM-barrel fold metal-dependent hydrolase
LATVFPGEEGTSNILAEAFEMGLSGVKMHCHVQCMKADDRNMEEIYQVRTKFLSLQSLDNSCLYHLQTCIRYSRPLLLHSGNAPMCNGLKCDPMELCETKYLDAALTRHPNLLICIPHLGMTKIEEHMALLEKHSNLYLDTTMTLGNYFSDVNKHTASLLLEKYSDRIIYGSDFPNIPYSWDQELKTLKELGLSSQALANILSANARKLYQIQPHQLSSHL